MARMDSKHQHTEFWLTFYKPGFKHTKIIEATKKKNTPKKYTIINKNLIEKTTLRLIITYSFTTIQNMIEK